ncbi:MAG TPA: DUF2059 domain-containing protein, partial [Thermoanaerobaculia bacterium]|nr:DUF2059 domain-containing protein [Thermoanaerobaculia bacterium]
MCLLVLGLVPLAARAAEPISSHRQAAVELLEAMDLDRGTTAMANATLDAQIQNDPSLAPYRDVFQKWIEKYLSWEIMKPRMIDLYMAAFTEPEMRDLIAFYKSPTGKKALAQIPVLMQQSLTIGMEMANQHQADLEEMVRVRKEEIAKAKKP